MRRHIAIFVSPRSRNRKAAEQVKAALLERGCSAELLPLDRTDPQIRAEKAKRDGAELIAVGGGDGTISRVLPLLKDVGLPLGVLPLGTGNALAKDLDLPTNPVKAAEALVLGDPVAIDLSSVNTHSFLNIASCGLSTAIVRNLDPELKKQVGKGAYLLAVLKAFFKAKPFQVRLIADDHENTFDTLLLIVANGRTYGGGMVAHPDAALNNGLLAYYSITSARRTEFIRILKDLWSGTHTELPAVDAGLTQELYIEATPYRHITTDGDIRTRTPARFTVEGRALQIVTGLSPDSVALIR
ncbi:MAG: diacylglycerol/lipid kinase family protein [Fimbriimonadaceae bacterium]